MNKVVVGLGETLWDVFPDGPRLGGAPLNFSCSAAELAKSDAQVFMVSSVGTDELGQRAVDAVAGHGVNTTCIQTDDRQTGQVLVTLDSAGVASYRFADNCAWDHLLWDDRLQKLATSCDAVCFGTLGQRSDVSRSTIQRFVGQTSENALRIFDVNLRAPFYNDEVISQSLGLANVLKLNDDELPLLADLFDIAGSRIEIMQQLAQKFQLRCIALTRGAEGAVLMCGSAISDVPGVNVNVVDTVGAGDAFTAAMTLGLLNAQDIERINSDAIAVASFVCSQPGATMGFPANLRATSFPSR